MSILFKRKGDYIMRVVESGRKYKFYNNAITTYEQLPAKTYRVAFNDQEGFFIG